LKYAVTIETPSQRVGVLAHPNDRGSLNKPANNSMQLTALGAAADTAR
jgi:hypothetical protein